jgi:hypothetical protein
MLKTGFDCFAPVSAATLVRAKAHGYSFVARYYGSPGSSKLLLPAEARRITDAGLRIFSVFERTSGRPLEGAAAGQADATLAMVQARAAGQPEGSTICFAVDQDIDMSANGDALYAYFDAARSALGGRYRVGGYGGGDVLGYLLNENLISVAWLAGAMGWRGSRAFDASRKWHLKQGATVSGGDLGIDYDPNVAVDLDTIGAWSLDVVPVQSPAPVPPAAVTPIETIKRIQEALGVVSDGAWGRRSRAALNAVLTAAGQLGI